MSLAAALTLGLNPHLITDAMGHVPRGHHLPGFLAMTGLVIEKYISGKRFQERGLLQTAKKQGFVQANIPLTQRANHPLVRRRRTGGYQSCADRTGLFRKLTLQYVQRGQKPLERTAVQGLARRFALAGLERG